MSDDAAVPLVFARWERFTSRVLDLTSKMPRSVRFTLVSRVDDLVLDVFERLVEARYAADPSEKRRLLQRANLDIEKLRLFFRLLTERKLLADRTFHELLREIGEAGRMVGGWIRSLPNGKTLPKLQVRSE